MGIGRRLFDVVRSELRGLMPDGSTAAGRGPAAGAAAASSGGARPQDPKLARYYANLELDYGADLAAVKSAWRRLARKYHPDLHSNDPEKRQVAEELIKGLNVAYEELESALEKGRVDI